MSYRFYKTDIEQASCLQSQRTLLKQLHKMLTDWSSINVRFTPNLNSVAREYVLILTRRPAGAYPMRNAP
jgi:hypothetical protein